MPSCLAKQRAAAVSTGDRRSQKLVIIIIPAIAKTVHWVTIMSEAITTPVPPPFSKPDLTRWKAFAIHLCISAAIAVAVVLWMIFVWFPPPYFDAEGGRDLLLILLAVDVVLGPMITLVVFKPGKPSLRFDLSVIALSQICALIYGCHVMFVSRPVFIVFTVDHFVTVRAFDLEDADIAQASRPEFRSRPLTGPVQVAVELPKDADEIRKIAITSMQSGKGLHRFPRLYVPYSEYRARALATSRPIEFLAKGDKPKADMVIAFIAKIGRKASELNYVPVQTRAGFGMALLDAKNGDLVELFMAQ